MALTLLLIIPAALGLAAFFTKSLKMSLAMIAGAAAAHAAGTISLWLNPGAVSGPLFRIDAMGLLFLSILSVVFAAASFYTIPYLINEERGRPVGPTRFVPCMILFLSAMTVVTVTDNLALMWAAVEGTTLASAPLVYFHRRKASLEATWKYLILCSVGIAVALMGTFFLVIAASGADGATPGLSLSALMNAAPGMSRPWLKAAFVLALVGYGTKMGLVPFHTWLPDTHSQSPSPISALLSGALLNCAFLAILRFYQVCIASGNHAFAQTLLVILGFASLGVAAAFMVAQADYKRMFAYSSIENMGIMAIGVGLGGTAVYGAMYHAVNHAACKAGLFFLAGNLYMHYKSTLAADVRAVSRRLPMTGALLAALFLAIGGTPPFGSFWSEFVIFQAALHSARPWLGAAYLIMLAIGFLGMGGVLLPMLQAPSDNNLSNVKEPVLSVAVPLAMAAAALALGLYIPPALAALLHGAAGLLGG